MIVRLQGGLGNQMFQYAFGASRAKQTGELVAYHPVALGAGSNRAYGLNVFKTDAKIIADVNVTGVSNYYTEATFAFDKWVAMQQPGTYFIGNFQTEKYFDEQLVREHFQLKDAVSSKTLTFWKAISMQPSCSLHVRRTDYLVPSTAAYHGIMGMDYYNAAIQYIKQRTSKIHFFVFSDDPAWCRGQFAGPEFTIVDANGMGDGNTGPSTEHEDLFLMAQCTHAIIPNSSFGWWGAWLNADKMRMVIAPRNWFNPTGPAKDFDTKDIVPERWVRL